MYKSSEMIVFVTISFFSKGNFAIFSIKTIEFCYQTLFFHYFYNVFVLFDKDLEFVLKNPSSVCNILTLTVLLLLQKRLSKMRK